MCRTHTVGLTVFQAVDVAVMEAEREVLSIVRSINWVWWTYAAGGFPAAILPVFRVVFDGAEHLPE